MSESTGALAAQVKRKVAVMEQREQIEAMVRATVSHWEEDGGRGWAAFVQMWTELRRPLRALRDTAITLSEYERTVLLVLPRLQQRPDRAKGEALAA